MQFGLLFVLVPAVLLAWGLRTALLRMASRLRRAVLLIGLAAGLPALTWVASLTLAATSGDWGWALLAMAVTAICLAGTVGGWIWATIARKGIR